MIADKTPVFVVGTGRCGSTLVSDILRGHPDVLSLSEFFTVLGREEALSPRTINADEFWSMLSQPREDATMLLRMGVDVPELLFVPEGPDDPRLRQGVPPLLLVPLPHLAEDPEGLLKEVERFVMRLPRGQLSNLYGALFDWLCRRLGKSLWVERSGGSLTYLSQLLRFWPNAKFVHIYRDGRECAYSMSRHPFFRLLLAGTVAARSGTDVGPAPDISDAAHYASLRIPLRHFGLYWSTQIVHGMRLLGSLAEGRVLRVRYEEIQARPEKEISRLVTFVWPGSDDAAWVTEAAKIVRQKDPRWPGLSRADRALLHRVCRPGLRALGIDSHPQRRASPFSLDH